jgi:uncharacterized membrane protein YedE/YeeE
MFVARLPWYVAGPLVGLLIIALRAAVNRPFGALGGYIDLAEHRASFAQLGFRAFLLFGLLVGGAVYALAAGTLGAPVAYGTSGGLLPGDLGSQTLLLVGAGLIMGYGARTAGGCTSGHGMSGMSLISPASLVATATFFATAVILANAFRLIGGAP